MQDYDRLITFQVATETQGATGEVNPSWANSSTAWAKVVPVGGNETLNLQLKKEVSTELNRFTLRYQSGITERHRISYSGKQFDIVSIKERGRQDELEIVGALVQ